MSNNQFLTLVLFSGYVLCILMANAIEWLHKFFLATGNWECISFDDDAVTDLLTKIFVMVKIILYSWNIMLALSYFLLFYI